MINARHFSVTVNLFLAEAPAASASFLKPGAMSAAASAVTSITPPAIGAYWEGQGGIYSGVMRGEESQPDYHLIVPTHESILNHKAAFGGYEIDETGAVSRFDGLANTLALVASDTDHPAAQWCHRLVVEGHSDLYLPAILECALIAANLPDLFDKEWHLSSSQRSASSAFYLHFGGGYQDDDAKNDELLVRPVRRLFI
jgi:hypothetical protein